MAGCRVHTVLGGLLAMAVALVAACAPAAGPATPPTQPAAAPAASPAAAPTAAALPLALQKVRYGELGIRGDVGAYLAMDEGYFAEQGIELETITFDSAANMVAPLATNQIDVGAGAPSAGLYNALRSGVNVRIVADRGHSDPTPPGYPVSIYLVRKALVDSGQVKGISDLKGLRFAQPARGISPELDLYLFLQQGGLTPGDLDTTIMSFPDMVSAYANDNLDFSFIVEPFASIALNQGTVVVLGYDYQVNPYYQVAVMLYSPEFSKSDLATRFMVAYLRGVRLYNDASRKNDLLAQEKYINSLIAHTPLKNRALYEQMSPAALHPDGKLDLPSFDRQQDWFLSTGTQQARVDLSQFIDLQHVEAAGRQLGPYR